MAVKELQEWGATAATNTDAAGFPDGYPGDKTPIRLRELQAAIARHVADAAAGGLATTGTGAAYALAPGATGTDYAADGIPDEAVFAFLPHKVSDATPTLAVGGDAARSIVWPDVGALAAGALNTHTVAVVRYDLANTRFVLIQPFRTAPVAPQDDAALAFLSGA